MNELSLLELLEGTGVGAPGWFGKMPLLGDFANRRLPQHFIDACDAWLARGIETSRSQLGERWLDVYLNGPLWRFAWAPQVIDDQWWFGVMMPSVDKVGRYFPLLIARPSERGPANASACEALSNWYAHLSAAALGTLSAGATLEDFESRLARAPALVDEVVPGVHCAPTASPLPGRVRHTAQGAVSLLVWVQSLVGHEALQRFAGQSLWWPDHAALPDNSLSVSQGLPAAQHFSELLEGRW